MIKKRCLQVPQEDVHDQHWYAPVPGQPGSSLLSVTLWHEAKMVQILYNSALETVCSWDMLSCGSRWAPDRSMLGRLEPARRGLPQICTWQPSGSPQTSAAALTCQQAAEWLARGSCVLRDWAWSSTSSTLLLVRQGEAGRVLIWQPGTGHVQCTVPASFKRVTWRSCGRHFMLQSGSEMAGHPAADGARLLQFGPDEVYVDGARM